MARGPARGRKRLGSPPRALGALGRGPLGLVHGAGAGRSGRGGPVMAPSPQRPARSGPPALFLSFPLCCTAAWPCAGAGAGVCAGARIITLTSEEKLP